MGGDACAEAADGMAEDGPPGQVLAAQGFHHGDVGGEVARPAHADGGEDGDIIAGHLADLGHGFDDADGGSAGPQGGHGDSDGLGGGETEDGAEEEGQLLPQPGEKGDPLTGCTGIDAPGPRPIGQEEDNGADAQDSRDDGHAHVHAPTPSIQEGFDEALAYASRSDNPHGGGEAILHVHAGPTLFAIFLLGGPQHEADADHASHDGPQVSDQGGLHGPIHRQGHHGCRGDQAHAEGRPQVGQGGLLVVLEIADEVLLRGQGQDGRVIREIAIHHAQGGRPRQVIDGAHDQGEDLIDQGN